MKLLKELITGDSQTKSRRIQCFWEGPKTVERNFANEFRLTRIRVYVVLAFAGFAIQSIND
jgi:hypothetical protein